MSKKAAQHIYLFDNLHIASFDTDGEQIPALQKSVVDLLIAEAKRNTISLDGCTIHYQHSRAWKVTSDKNGTHRHIVPA